jgi:vacuolar protein-sorting-associated protein 4
MQGVKDDSNICVLAATSLPWTLNPYLRRLFEKRIYIPLPDFDARLGMLIRGVKDNQNTLQDCDFQELAKRTEGLSGSDVIILIRDSLM